MACFELPSDYHRIKIVGSFEELVSTPFADGVNAMCWPRELAGDFDEIVEKLATGDGITTVDDDWLWESDLSEAGKAAREVLLRDQAMMREAGLDPVLDCIKGDPGKNRNDLLRTDVGSFHADSATVQADTFLCSYNVAATEGLRNEEAIPRAEVPETRAELLRLYGGADDEGFVAYLHENFHDLHYVAAPEAKPYSFGFGHLWRVAIVYPGSPVPPCVHRAPGTKPGERGRLLLLS